MNTILNMKYKLDSDFEIERREAKYLFFDRMNSNWLRTNITGYDFLKSCDGSQSIQKILEQNAEDLGFPYKVLERKFMPFIKRAIDRKVLLPEGGQRIVVSTSPGNYPVDIWVHVTDSCNMHCPFCYSASDKEGKRQINKDKVLNFLSNIPEKERKNIIISGGEPFVFSDLPLLTKELNNMGFSITVITNGTIGNELYSEVIPYIDTLQVSVDGSKEEIYEFTRGKGNYHKVLHSLSLAHKIGMQNIVVSFTTNTYNLSDIENMPRFAMEHHVNHLHITKIIPSGRANKIMDKIVPDVWEYKDGIQRLAKALVETNNIIEAIRTSDESILPEKEKTKFITMSMAADPVRKVIEQTKITTCSLANGTISIGYDEMIYPCGCLQFQDLKLGSIDDHIDEIMSRGKEVFNKYSVENEEMSQCFECNYKYICAGGCRACAYADGKEFGEDPCCEFYKSRIEDVMWNSMSDEIIKNL